MADDETSSTAQPHRSEAKHDKRAVRRDLRACRRRRRDDGDAGARTHDGEMLLTNALPVVANARWVATFEPLDTEPNLAPLNAHLLKQGRVLVPITLDDLDLSWRDLATGEDLGKDAIALADVIIAPALAIGPTGERLGQGGGCYDRALPRRREGVSVVAVTFADEHPVAFPTEPHDERVDAVLTTNGITRFAPTLK